MPAPEPTVIERPDRTNDAGITVARVAVAALAVQAAMVGAWAAFAPSSFATDFPAVDWGWISADGPYNEHLVRDVGVLYLGFATLTAFVALRPTAAALRVAGAAWLVQSVLHLVYHARNTEPHEAGVAVAILTSVSLPVVLAAVALFAPGRGARVRDPVGPPA